MRESLVSDTSIPVPDDSTDEAIAEAIAGSDPWAGAPENIYVNSPRGTFVALPVDLKDLPGVHDIHQDYGDGKTIRPFSVWFSNPGEHSIVYPGAFVLADTIHATSFWFRDQQYFIFDEAGLICIVMAAPVNPPQTERERAG